MERQLRTGLFVLAIGFCIALSAYAEDNVLLLQTGPQGTTVWHTEGTTQLDDDVLLELVATATPDGGPEIDTPLGPARAYVVPEATVIRFMAVMEDNALLVERDACGHIKAWHAAGKTRLTADQVDELLLTALPGGGQRLVFGEHYAKGFVSNIGVTVTLWRMPHRITPESKVE